VTLLDALAGELAAAGRRENNRAEEIIGAALEGISARPVVLTKCGDVRGPDGRAYDDHSPAVIRADVRASQGLAPGRPAHCPVRGDDRPGGRAAGGPDAP
jgi:hypothetical protein